jgi:putative DNA primase/helicase
LRNLKNRAHLKTASLMAEVTAILRANQDSETDMFAERADPLSLVNCENGEVRLQKDGSIKLRSHRPSSGQLHTLPVKYDPDAECPEYDRALDEIFANAKDKDGLVRHWHDLVGYVIQPARPFPIIVVLLGKGANGKTRLLNTITRLLGDQATYFGNVDHLEGSRFSLGALKGKLLFADDDVKIRLKLPDGVLKKISEAKLITGEQKYKNPTTFTSRAVPFLLCNGIPFLSDVTNGMMRRLHIIPFMREFSGEERDPALFERIWANELPGVLNRSLQGWSRLKDRGDFDIPIDARRMAKKWLVHANPVSAFIDECVTRGVDGRVPLREVYTRFVQWARDSGIQRALTRQALGVDLDNLDFTLKKSNGERVVYGLKLR